MDLGFAHWNLDCTKIHMVDFADDPSFIIMQAGNSVALISHV